MPSKLLILARYTRVIPAKALFDLVFTDAACVGKLS
jgi:hypothetical protein